MLVVLPAPLTPTTMITVGVSRPTASARSSGASRSAIASTSSVLTASGSVAPASLTRRFRSPSRKPVALTPASAISSAASSSSYSASSIFVPVKTLAMPEPVLRNPLRSLSSQPLRGGSGAASTTGGASTAGKGAGAAGAASGAGGAFFLKKLNMARRF